MIVRLKVTLVINEDDFYNGFNSMIVRLKGGIECLMILNFLRFNSMIVRLKGGGWDDFSGGSRKFQFYDSPIKRIYSYQENKSAIQSFNSMIVRLKDDPNFFRFFFNEECFNSMIVRLKVAITPPFELYIKMVSIL